MPEANAVEAAPTTNIKLWDLPVRLVHWAFVLLLPALWWTGEQGDLDTHKLIGYAMIALVLFRLVWGFIGSETARFVSFVRGPVAVLSYLRGAWQAKLGHNPVGALSVLLLLALLAGQIALGLIAENEDMEHGPLSHFVSYDMNAWAAEMHEIGFNVLLGVIGVHVLAVLFYQFVRKDRLIEPMVTGTKAAEEPLEQPRLAPLWLALVVGAGATAIAWWISKGAPLGGG